jgi:hypothetical protein
LRIENLPFAILGQTVAGTEKGHVKSVKEKNFRAGVEAEGNGWGHEIEDFRDGVCQEIECRSHTGFH